MLPTGKGVILDLPPVRMFGADDPLDTGVGEGAEIPGGGLG